MASKPAEALHLTDSDYNQKKKEQISSRLQKRDQTRLTDADRRRAVREEAKVTEEKLSFFTKHFQEEFQNIENMIKCEAISSGDRTSLLEHFDSITASFQRLQKFFNDSVMFLSSYESRKAQSQLTSLQAKINDKRAEMLPKKKFAFKSKTKSSTDTVTATSKPSVMEKYSNKAAQFKQDCEVSGQNNESITLKSDDINLKDVSLSHLTGCKIFLFGAPGTVHISDVKGCTIVIGPVSGSVFVDRCHDTTIAAGCQQLRVHHTHDTDFYLHVTSRAIIEDTTNVRFAPYNVEYVDREKHFQLSGLDKSKNNWTEIDDFNWLAMDTASPNWKLIDESERKTTWE
ncbi:tubulin-specific chaperone C-like [Clavelina lepadiformis]|uniref:C-CAP/cofactor C-like domain-containing protein n=1 Tax=Clavelina lepadiformis TaxID=159417 RepID=A0ABP0FWA0_CLALP